MSPSKQTKETSPAASRSGEPAAMNTLPSSTVPAATGSGRSALYISPYANPSAASRSGEQAAVVAPTAGNAHAATRADEQHELHASLPEPDDVSHRGESSVTAISSGLRLVNPLHGKEVDIGNPPSREAHQRANRAQYRDPSKRTVAFSPLGYYQTQSDIPDATLASNSLFTAPLFAAPHGETSHRGSNSNITARDFTLSPTGSCPILPLRTPSISPVATGSPSPTSNTTKLDNERSFSIIAEPSLTGSSPPKVNLTSGSTRYQIIVEEAGTPHRSAHNFSTSRRAASIDSWRRALPGRFVAEQEPVQAEPASSPPQPANSDDTIDEGVYTEMNDRDLQASSKPDKGKKASPLPRQWAVNSREQMPPPSLPVPTMSQSLRDFTTLTPSPTGSGSDPSLDASILNFTVPATPCRLRGSTNALTSDAMDIDSSPPVRTPSVDATVTNGSSQFSFSNSLTRNIDIASFLARNEAERNLADDNSAEDHSAPVPDNFGIQSAFPAFDESFLEAARRAPKLSLDRLPRRIEAVGKPDLNDQLQSRTVLSPFELFEDRLSENVRTSDRSAQDFGDEILREATRQLNLISNINAASQANLHGPTRPQQQISTSQIRNLEDKDIALNHVKDATNQAPCDFCTCEASFGTTNANVILSWDQSYALCKDCVERETHASDEIVTDVVETRAHDEMPTLDEAFQDVYEQLNVDPMQNLLDDWIANEPDLDDNESVGAVSEAGTQGALPLASMDEMEAVFGVVITLTVKMNEDVQIVLECVDSDTIEFVKHRVKSNTGINSETYHLLLKGLLLRERKTLKDYGIPGQATLHAIQRTEVEGHDTTRWMGVTFCHGCQWTTVDITKAHICGPCRKWRHKVVAHSRHGDWQKIIAGDVIGNDGTVVKEGDLLTKAARKQCMICIGHATQKCGGCSLRLCANCQVTLTTWCKGNVNMLTYHYDRMHVRNDVLLLRSDGGGVARVLLA